jgi:hypothetical protein
MSTVNIVKESTIIDTAVSIVVALIFVVVVKDILVADVRGGHGELFGVRGHVGHGRRRRFSLGGRHGGEKTATQGQRGRLEGVVIGSNDAGSKDGRLSPLVARHAYTTPLYDKSQSISKRTKEAS